MLPYVKQWSPVFQAPGTSFTQDSFSTGIGDRGMLWDDSSTLHNKYIYYVLYFYYYISSISDHQALDPGGQRFLMQGIF